MTNNKFNRNLERFKIALEARKFEIEMFWRRTNYFLLLNTSAAIGAGTAAINNRYGLFVVACFIGFSVCMAWRDVVRGAKFWQNYWEQVVNDIQESVGFEESPQCEKNGCTDEKCNAGNNACKAKDFFSPIEVPHVKMRVRKSLKMKEFDPANTEREGSNPSRLICEYLFLFIGLSIFYFVWFVYFSAHFSVFWSNFQDIIGDVIGYAIWFAIISIFWFAIVSFFNYSIKKPRSVHNYTSLLAVLPIFWFVLFFFLSVFLPINLSVNLSATMSFFWSVAGAVIMFFFWCLIYSHTRSGYKEDVLKKPSVSRSMQTMADFSLIAWVAALAYVLLCLLSGEHLNSICWCSLNETVFVKQCPTKE